MQRVEPGQPVPESNFVSELNSSLPQAPQRYMPSAFECVYAPVNGGSVPFSRRMWKRSGGSSSRHSCSVFAIFSAMPQRYRCSAYSPASAACSS